MPQEDNNENVVENNTVENTDNKKDETKTTEKQETKNNSERLYTQDELNDIISKRLARFKFEAVEHSVDEKTKDLTDRLKVLEDERNTAIREAQVLKLSKETGIDADVLIQTQLEGEALTNFANTLKEKSSSWNVKTSDLENAVLNGAPKENDYDDFYRTLMGGN